VGRTVGNPVRLDHDRFRTALGELTEAVRNEGGRIAAQLHHTGRQNSRANIGTGEAPVSASDGPASRYGDPPRGLTLQEIPGIIDKYAQAARRAVLAGFDAVEVHGAHGYLPGQFLSPKTSRPQHRALHLLRRRTARPGRPKRLWAAALLRLRRRHRRSRRAAGKGGRHALSAPAELPGGDAGPGNRYLYARTPWGSTVELVTYPSPQAYEATTDLRRWRPEVS
jgi:hypothetical protein